MNRTFLFCSFFISSLCFAQKTEVHGHRGFRGHFPENTLTAFKEAAKAGVDYIEFDVVISKDSQVVISHEPWFNSFTCSEPDGSPVKKNDRHNLHTLFYSEIKSFDCGKRGNPKFPSQQKIAEYKPLLSEMIETMEAYTLENHLPPLHYNLEIKCNKMGDGKYHPGPEEMAELVYAVLKKHHINERILIQSFDRRSLQAIHRLDLSIKTGLLVANVRSVKHNIHRLGYIPTDYNPAMKLCRQKTIRQAHTLGCKVVAWTVNSEKDMKRIIATGADRVITDYPDLALRVR